jgi:hypothetical protein
MGFGHGYGYGYGNSYPAENPYPAGKPVPYIVFHIKQKLNCDEASNEPLAEPIYYLKIHD